MNTNATVSESINTPDARLLAIHLLETAPPQRLDISSGAFKHGGLIPVMHSEFGSRLSPDLTIVNVPAAAKSLVLLLEDPDAPNPKPFIHWVIYNLPPSTTMIRAGQPEVEHLTSFDGARQAKNSAGTTGYFGMKPPASHGAHHYHFQVFALDEKLTFGANEVTDRSLIVQKIKGHVLAAGDLIGLFKAPK